MHDVGRVAVASGIWDKPGALTAAQWERVRLHPYWTGRVLARSPTLEVTAEELESISVPTLIVGARDSGPAFAEVANLTAQAMPTARVERVEGSHLVDAAHPAVVAFVADVLAGAGASVAKALPAAAPARA